MSPDVEDLVLQCGHALARKRWRSSGARNEAEARSWWVSHCRMRIGVATARAYARYRLKRLVFVGVPRAVLDERAQRGLAGGARDAGANEGGGTRAPTSSSSGNTKCTCESTPTRPALGRAGRTCCARGGPPTRGRESGER